MQLENPVEALAARTAHVPAEGNKRDWQGLLAVVSQWSRKCQVSMKSGLKEMNWRQFKAKHKKLGYRKPQYKAIWAKMTTAECYKRGLCRKHGSKVYVWYNKGRECDSADIIQLELKGEESKSLVSKEQSKKMLQGKHGVEMSAQAKAETFGGSA